MQVIVKTNYDGQEAREAIENVTSVSRLNIDSVAVNFMDDGRSKTQFIKLDGYTELIVR